jgi:hypothetical protein
MTARGAVAASDSEHELLTGKLAIHRPDLADVRPSNQAA